jgi:uncharacterized repeat protein (TIGR03803 family)
LAFILLLGTAPAQTFSVLYEFTNVPDGAHPSVLISDSAGNFYGTTAAGGTVCDIYGDGCGTVFELDANGAETILYRFSGGADGRYPEAALVRDAAGNLYGTTAEGGSGRCQRNQQVVGCGAVFKLDHAGNETVLYSFDGVHGAGPSGLVRDSQGNFYGVAGGSGSYKYGIVFEVSAAGKESVLHRFTGGSDGGYPFGGVILDSSGNLYGLTQNASYGFGTIFKVAKGGKKSVLHRFSSSGVTPYDSLIRGADGNFYGTTFQGGGSNGCNNDDRGCGTVFDGEETVLYTFGTEGSDPLGGLLLDAAGNLYGSGGGGTGCGYGGCGVIFKLTP